MVRPAHVCCGVVFLQPQSTVLMAYQPGASGVPAFSPTVSPGCVTEPARAGAAVQSDRTPAAANFVNLLFICDSPIAPRRRSVADRSAEPHLLYGPRCFCPMVTRSRQIAPRTFLFWGLFAEMLFAHSHHAWHWSITQIVEHSLAASHDGFANSYWNVWQCGRGDTHATAQEVRLKGIRLVYVCCGSVSVSSALHFTARSIGFGSRSSVDARLCSWS